MLNDAEQVTQAIRNAIAERRADGLIHTTRTLCNGRCEDACVVIAYPEGRWYKEMTAQDGAALVDALLKGDDFFTREAELIFSRWDNKDGRPFSSGNG